MWSVVVVLACIVLTAVPGSATRYLTEAEITQQVCYSSSHGVNGQLYISAPPSGPVDVVVIPGTFKRYVIDCINVVQSGPALLEYQKPLCNNLATAQEFYVCTSPASLGDGRSWTCAGPISEYVRDKNHDYVIGSEYGDALNIKIQWRPSPSAGVVCFPQYINTIVTGRDGATQKTNLGLIISMSILGFLLIAAGVYVGIYILRKSCNKFFVHMEKGKGHHTTRREGKAQDEEENAGEVGGVSEQLNTMRNARPPTAEEQAGVRDKGLLKDAKLRNKKNAKKRDPYLDEEDDSEEDALRIGAPPVSGRYTNRNATEVEEGVFSARRLDPYEDQYGSQSRGGGGEDGMNQSPSSKHHASIVIVPLGSGGEHPPASNSYVDGGYGGTKFAHSSRNSHHTNNNASMSSAGGSTRNQKHYGDVLVPATVGGIPSSVLYGNNYADVNPTPPHSGPQETFLPTHLVSVPMRKGWLDAYDSQRARERARVDRRQGGADDMEYDEDDEGTDTSAIVPSSLEAQSYDRRLAAQPRHHEVVIDQHLSRREAAVSGGAAGAPSSSDATTVARRLPIQLDESRPDYLSPPNRDANGRLAKGKSHHSATFDRHQDNVEGLEWIVLDGHGRDPAGHDLSPYARHHDRFAVGDSISIIYEENVDRRQNAPY